MLTYSSFKIFQEDLRDMDFDLLLYDCFFSTFVPVRFGYGTAINLNLFERVDVYRCEYGEKKTLLDLILSANTLTVSPFPGTN